MTLLSNPMHHSYSRLVLFLAALNAGCQRPTNPVPEPVPAAVAQDNVPADQRVLESDLEFFLPLSYDAPHETPPRVYQLTIDGQDRTQPRHNNLRVLRVRGQPGKRSVLVTYSFWPRTYINAERTKVIELAEGKRVKVDLTAEDPKRPDQLKVIYYPTPPDVVRKMCQLAGVGKDDMVYDLGCGDGRIVLTALKEFGAPRGVGLDINPDLIERCQRNAERAGLADQTQFRVEDVLKIQDLSEASVVFLYMGDELNLKLRPVLRATLRPGARIVSHCFTMGDWKPTRTCRVVAMNEFGKLQEYELFLWNIE